MDVNRTRGWRTNLSSAVGRPVACIERFVIEHNGAARHQGGRVR